MYLKLSYGTIEHTTEFITSNSSYKLEEVYYNELSHADNSCSVKIPFNVDMQNFINDYSDNSILAQIKNTDGTNIFTGYVRKNYDFSKAQKNQALSLELVSPSFLLDVDTTQDITLHVRPFPRKQVVVLVHALREHHVYLVEPDADVHRLVGERLVVEFEDASRAGRLVSDGVLQP